MSVVYLRHYEAPALSRAEVLRYMKSGTPTPETEQMLSECLDEVLPLLEYKVCWRRERVKRAETGLDIGIFSTASQGLAKALAGCDEALVFAATVGLAPDRLIARYGHLSPAKALCLQAIGAERIEALCEAFIADMEKEAALEGRALCPRYSPGYGDLPLTLQKEIFAALDCPRKIGLTLTASMLMSPTKSVTAIAGVRVREEKV